MIHERTLILELDFALGEIVYAKVDSEKVRGMVTAIYVGQIGVYYCVIWEGGDERRHYAMELTTEFVPHYEAEES